MRFYSPYTGTAVVRCATAECDRVVASAALLTSLQQRSACVATLRIAGEQRMWASPRRPVSMRRLRHWQLCLFEVASARVALPPPPAAACAVCSARACRRHVRQLQDVRGGAQRHAACSHAVQAVAPGGSRKQKICAGLHFAASSVFQTQHVNAALAWPAASGGGGAPARATRRAAVLGSAGDAARMERTMERTGMQR